MRWRLTALLLVLTAVPASAAVISSGPNRVAVTIYHEGMVDTASLTQGNDWRRGTGLALVTETRTIALPAGVSQIQFRGVAGTMVPQTAAVTGLPDIAERNFDFNLLTPAALIAKSVGQTVHVVRTDKDTGKTSDEAAVLRSGPDGMMLETAAGVEALHCSGLPERIVFDKVPQTLFDTPTLSVTADVPRAGRYTVTLRYIATGMNWSADYVARVNPDGRTLNLSGWITLANFSETSFAKAPVDVIAGQVNNEGEQPPELPVQVPDNACWQTNINWANMAQLLTTMSARAAPAPMAARFSAVESVVMTGVRSKEIEARDLGDLKLYPLPEPTDLQARQTKQVQFLERPKVPFQRVYRIRNDGNVGPDETILPATIVLTVQNTTRAGLGKPLPAGGIATMADGIVAGQDTIEDTAVGLPLEIEAGQTVAVSARARTVASTAAGRGRNRVVQDTLEVTVVNAKTMPVTFEWRQAMSASGSRITTATHPHDVFHGDARWRLALQPGRQTVLRYTLRHPG